MDLFRRVALPIALSACAWLAGMCMGLAKTADGQGLTYDAPTGLSGLIQASVFNLSLAILVAIAVAEWVERAHKKRVQAAEARMQDHTFINMFRRAFGSFFSDEVIQESIDTLFSKRLLRSKFYIEYTFKRHEVSQELIVIDSIVRFQVENISEITEPYEPRIMMPNLMAKYESDPVREPPRLLSATINGHEMSKEEIDDKNKHVRIDEDDSTIPLGSYDIAPGQIFHVRTESRMLKSRNGAETMRVYLPTKNVTVEVHNQCEGLHIEIKGNGSRPFPAKKFFTSDRCRWAWETEHLMLPENGWVLYWNDLSRNVSGLESVSHTAHEARSSANEHPPSADVAGHNPPL